MINKTNCWAFQRQDFLTNFHTRDILDLNRNQRTEAAFVLG